MSRKPHPNDSVIGTTYLIHLVEPLGDPSRPRMSAKHYIGWTNGVSVERRLEEHRSGQGARILAAAARRGIGFHVVRTWPQTDRHFERRLKNNGHYDKWCPICSAVAVPGDASAI